MSGVVTTRPCAPGELILVSDGLGGHMRQSGTSLAAPLVSGAIALLQTRWPWLSNYPDETASIILRSATPKGDNPGADPVYGVGMLNIAASQSPLDWTKLVYYSAINGKAGTVALPLSSVVTQIGGGTQSAWDASGLSFTAIERIGDTIRDFQIPLSSRLVGQNATTAAGGQSYQAYLTSALRAQAGYFAALAPAGGSQSLLVRGFARSTVPVGEISGATLRLKVAPSEIGNAFRMRTARYDADAMLVSDAGSLQFGFGNGAAALDGSAGFVFRSDYDLARGGANPLLGLATGGGYLGARAVVAPGLTLGFGTTDRLSRRNLMAFNLRQDQVGNWVDRYAAQAQNVSLAYSVGPHLTARLGYTRLHEDSALLGIQSLQQSDFGGGTVSEGATGGFDLRLGRSMSLSGSATIARSRTRGGQISSDRLTSMSAKLAVAKSNLFTRADEVRLSVSSPLHTVGGRLGYAGVAVVDRDTGALGTVTQFFAPRTTTPLAAEAMYGLALPHGVGEMSLFGRVDRSPELVSGIGTVAYTSGAQLRLAF